MYFLIVTVVLVLHSLAKQIMKRAVLSFAYLLLLFTLVVADDSAPTVSAPAGKFVGNIVLTREGKCVSAFPGLPYAKPPLGILRFEPPQRLDPLNTTYYATANSSSCVQSGGGSEDCLYLDLYTPKVDFKRPSKLLPVIVFFYGGAFESGSSKYYTQEYLLDHDVLFVAPQYRLGFFGFLSTGDKVVPGNMGFKDQRCALRWIKENIRSFGGDPDKVTIMGESAGAVSVHYLMLFSKEGLFRAVISQSGNALVPWAFRPPVEVRRMVELLANLTLCPSDSYGLVKCLRRLPAADLATLYAVKYKNAMYPGSGVPLIGGVLESKCVTDRLITANPWERHSTLPWLTGVNDKEGLIIFYQPTTDRTGKLFAEFDAAFGSSYTQSINYQSSSADGSWVAQAVRQFYLNNSLISQKTLNSSVDICSDPQFVYPFRESIKRVNPSQQTYAYMFDYIGCNQLLPFPKESRVGVSHGDELFFFFPNPGGTPRLCNTTEDTRLSKMVVKLWIQFATYLDPTPLCDKSNIGVKWRPFSCDETFLNICQDGFKLSRPFLRKRMNFWKNQPFPFRDDCYGELTD